MTDPSRYPDTEEDTGVGPDSGGAGGTPRWVFVLGICIAVVAILVFVVLHLTGTVGPGSK